MALKREMLKGMGLTEEQITAIIDGHTDTVNGLKDQIKAATDKAKELEDKLKGFEGGEDWKKQHDQLKKELDELKAANAAREQADKVKTAYKALLEAEKIDPKRHAVILRATDLASLKLTSDGKIENEDAVRGKIREDWADFRTETKSEGAPASNPPGNGGSGTGKTKAEIMAIKDTGERQRAIAENHELFGF